MFGIKSWKDVKFLIQEQVRSFPEGVPCPFEVPIMGSPTNIFPKHHGIVAPTDPVYKAFYPIPDGGVYVIRDSSFDFESFLKMTGAKDSAFPIWAFKPRAQHFTLTNMAPLVLYNVRNKDQKIIEQIQDLARLGERTVIFIAEFDTMIMAQDLVSPKKLTVPPSRELGEQALYNFLTGSY